MKPPGTVICDGIYALFSLESMVVNGRIVLFASIRRELNALRVFAHYSQDRWREYDARFPGAEYNVLLVDDCLAGPIWIGKDEKEIRPLDIGLLPEFQNRGVGTLLLRRRRGVRAGGLVRHIVFVLNDNAHRFYERLGFVIIEDVGAYTSIQWTKSWRTPPR